MIPERIVQPKFSFRLLAAVLILIAAIGLFARWLDSLPNRVELGSRAARIAFHPVQLDSRSLAPLRIAGAWRLTSDDPRLGGVSALAIDRGRLLALSDYGVVIRFSPPLRGRSAAQIEELPDGPGSGDFKRNRDSEGLARDPLGRGWWVAFENRHELWLYDQHFRHALQRIPFGRYGWSANRGVEGIAVEGDDLLLFPETGDRLLRVSGLRARLINIARPYGRISDVAVIEPERWIAIQRRLTAFGFRNALVMLDKAGSGYRFGRRFALPVRATDNVEAIAVERLPDGRLRLWLMTDDNFQPPLRTLLIALDWPGPRQ